MSDDEPWLCTNCRAIDPPIFLCEAEWWCEKCFREVSGFPSDIPSEELHDGINEGTWSGYIERIKQVYFGESLDEYEP